MDQAVAVQIKDPHMITFYNASGAYLGSVFVCSSGKIIGGPVITGDTVCVTWADSNNVKYMSFYSMKNMSFQRQIYVG